MQFHNPAHFLHWPGHSPAKHTVLPPADQLDSEPLPAREIDDLLEDARFSSPEDTASYVTEPENGHRTVILRERFTESLESTDQSNRLTRMSLEQRVDDEVASLQFTLADCAAGRPCLVGQLIVNEDGVDYGPRLSARFNFSAPDDLPAALGEVTLLSWELVESFIQGGWEDARDILSLHACGAWVRNSELMIYSVDEPPIEMHASIEDPVSCSSDEVIEEPNPLKEFSSDMMQLSVALRRVYEPQLYEGELSEDDQIRLENEMDASNGKYYQSGDGKTARLDLHFPKSGGRGDFLLRLHLKADEAERDSDIILLTDIDLVGPGPIFFREAYRATLDEIALNVDQITIPSPFLRELLGDMHELSLISSKSTIGESDARICALGDYRVKPLNAVTTAREFGRWMLSFWK